MDLTKEAIEQLERTAVKAAGPQAIPVEDPRIARFAVEGQVVDFAVPPVPRDHRVGSIEDLARIAEDLTDEMCHGMVFHGTDAVILLTDQDDRRDAVELHLPFSAPFGALWARAHTSPAQPWVFDQPGLVRFLRLTLAVDDPILIGKFRRIDWKQSDEGSAEVRHGVDKMGRAINAAVQGIDELPEWIDVDLPVYDVEGERGLHRVRLLLEIDAVNRQFVLVPRPGDLQRAIDEHQRDIADRLARLLPERVTHYYGTP